MHNADVQAHNACLESGMDEADLSLDSTQDVVLGAGRGGGVECGMWGVECYK